MPAFKKNESLPIEDRVLDLDGDEISCECAVIPLRKFNY
eukprot:SAG31_NODE_1451_length_8305_cov_8.321350_4_plen_39_part_00